MVKNSTATGVIRERGSPYGSKTLKERRRSSGASDTKFGEVGVLREDKNSKFEGVGQYNGDFHCTPDRVRRH